MKHVATHDFENFLYLRRVSLRVQPSCTALPSNGYAGAAIVAVKVADCVCFETSLDADGSADRNGGETQ